MFFNSKDFELSTDFKSCLRHFVFYYTNGTLQYVIGDDEILKDIDYREDLKNEASMVEETYSIYINNLKFDKNGKVLNNIHSMKRAAQFIRSVCDVNYIVEPDFEQWEIELY